MTDEPTEKRLEDVRKGQLIVMTPEEWNAEQRAVPVFTARERKVRPFGNAGIEKRKEHEDIQRQLMMLSPPKAAFMMDDVRERYRERWQNEKRKVARERVLGGVADDSMLRMMDMLMFKARPHLKETKPQNK